MHADILDLREFYASPLGHLAKRSIGMALKPLWPSVPSERLVGLGYAVPWLDALRERTERSFAFMPAGMGAAPWPQDEPSLTALVFDEELPLTDSSIDRILMIHALEHSEDPRETLKEAWRVLAPGGRLVVVVPNRRGIWARTDVTPFGNGRPYSKRQLTQLLRDANFTPGEWNEALLFPPSHRKSVQRATRWMEGFGRRVAVPFAGALLVEAQKRMYQGLPVSSRSSRRVFVPVLSPQGAGRLTGKSLPD
ncbi:MAG: methyltransferase domain-containing protein [Rhizobiaceae bacterium]